MSRVSARTPPPKRQPNYIEPNNKYSHIEPVTKILHIFIANKQKQNIKSCWTKCKHHAYHKKNIYFIIATLLNRLQVTKSKLFISAAFRKFQYNRDQLIKKENLQIQTKKQNIRNRSATLLFLFLHKLLINKIKEEFHTLAIQTAFKYKFECYRTKHIGRIFTTLLRSKFRLVFMILKKTKVTFINRRNKLKRVQKIINLKKQFNIANAFLKIKLAQLLNKQDIAKPVSSAKNSRVRPTPTRSVAKKYENAGNQEDEKVVLQDKNRKLEQQIKYLKQQNSNKIQEYRKYLAQQQAEHERLKFNSGILDEAIRQLQTQILNRQKRARKGLSISQLWERVYSNFLFLLNQYSGQVLPKQKILEYLEVPLVPLAIDVEALKSENFILTELLQEYKNFYQDIQLPQLDDQDYLPYDFLMIKNKYYYSAVESLIRQGLGTEEEIKQLQSDLENVIKQT